jgi:plasmid maintenance system antidote protein VapI
MDDTTFLSVTAAFLAFHGIRKKDVARRLQVSPSTFSEILSGTRPLRQDLRERLIEILQLQPVIEECEREVAANGLA